MTKIKAKGEAEMWYQCKVQLWKLKYNIRVNKITKQKEKKKNKWPQRRLEKHIDHIFKSYYENEFEQGSFRIRSSSCIGQYLS